MKEDLFKRLGNLLTIKSLVTLALTVVFCVLAILGRIGEDVFDQIFTVVIAFYFGTQAERKVGGR